MVEVDEGYVGAGGEGGDGVAVGVDSDTVDDPEGSVGFHQPGGSRFGQVSPQRGLGAGGSDLQCLDEAGVSLGHVRCSGCCHLGIGLLVQVDDDAEGVLGAGLGQRPRQGRLDDTGSELRMANCGWRMANSG